MTQNKRHDNKTKRMNGMKYETLSKANILCDRMPRQMGETCTSNFCLKSSVRHCAFFSENIRQEIFTLFWKMTWEQKKLYVISLVECSNRKRICVENSRRLNTKCYYLNHTTKRVQVCSKMFFSTLGLSEKMVRNWLNSSGLHCTQISPENQKSIRSERKKGKQHSQYEKRLSFFEKWLEGIPKLESHYRRQYTKKLYFEANFKSYTQMYELYSLECKAQQENEISAISFPNFMEKLKERNYSIFKPRNDQCDLCVSYKANNISKDQFESHRKEVEIMRNEKANDIENAKSGICLLLCIDMQAVKLVPQTKANSSYYKMKLQVHNFTIYNVITHESNNYVWDETEGSLVASTFATCILKHLRHEINISPETNHIIIYSDGCFYQNRNVILSNALLSLCVEKKITIEHKYLIVGHTQMECDSTHSIIQRKINNKQINLPSQLVDLIKDARKNPFPLQVHHLSHEYFLDFESVPKRYSSIRPGKKSGDPTVNMIRTLAYDCTGHIYFKTNINDDYELLPQRTERQFVDREPNQLHTQRINISKKKWQHLQDLKPLIPADCHNFYDSIPFEN